MKRTALLLLSLLLLGGCATISESSKEREPLDQRELNLSLMYYSMAQTAMQIEDYTTAIQYLRMAEKHNPRNILIKEKLIELLSYLAITNEDLNHQIISLGEQYWEDDSYNSAILFFIAQAYNRIGNIERAEFFYREALEYDPTMEHYYAFFLFQKEQNLPTEFELLQKALDLEWERRTLVIRSIELLADHDPKAAISYFERAYNKWYDEYILQRLLRLYDSLGEKDKIIQLLEERLHSQHSMRDQFKVFLLGQYYFDNQFDKILDNRELCLQLNNTDALRFLFFSALRKERYAVVIEAGDAILQNDDLPKDLLPNFYSYLGEAYFREADIENAAKYFLLSDSIQSLLPLFNQFAQSDDQTIEDKLLQTLQKLESTDSDLTNFICAYTYDLLDMNEEVRRFLDNVSLEFLRENQLLQTAALTYLSAAQDVEKAQKLLEHREEHSPTFYEIAGVYFFNSRADSLAYHYLKKEIEESEPAAANVYILATISADKIGQVEDIFPLLESAVSYYPENADLLNTYAYLIADYELDERYETAEKLLNQALEMDPENIMYWDSLAWLFYRKGEYAKALEAMKLPMENEIDNSEMAYHLGAIYYQLEDTDQAIHYLRLAVQLENHDRSVEKSKELLNKIKQEE
jgi:tetratricopeptide (TPR) repeat protein